MSDAVPDSETAIELATQYAESDCVGQFGEITDVEDRDATWVVEFRTHTFADRYSHRIEVTKSVGNVITHDRSSRLE